jgi:hypothetical protein
MYLSNIFGHLPTKEYVDKAKAGKLQHLLKDRLEVRSLASITGWKTGETTWPVWFQNSLK